jgi:hypothetical protein
MNEDSASPNEVCMRCRALEERVAELERRLAAVDSGLAQSETILPPFHLRALRLVEKGWGEGWKLRPSPQRRAWLDSRPHSYKCLPMVVANQWGWQILCPADVRVTWDGGRGIDGLVVEVEPAHAGSVRSQFGDGIVTFSPPWLFRTPPGWDLYAKGPSNRWKTNCQALEGVIETWWLNFTFTLNWKLVEPGSVIFSKGESIGQLLPVPHATFRHSTAEEALLATADPVADAELRRWLAERRRIASTPVVTHGLYRRAEGVPGHLMKVPVPEVRKKLPGEPNPSDGT